MPIKIKSTSGSVTLDAQNVSGDQTLTVPSLAGGKTLLTTDGDGSSLTGVGVDGIVSTANATAITIDSSEKVAVGGSGSVSVDSQVAVKGGNLELSTAGSRYWIARASDGALTGSLYSPTGSELRLSGAGTGSGSITFEPSSTSGAAVTLNSAGNMGLGVTPETWASNKDAIQIGIGASLASNNGSSELFLSNNYYEAVHGSPKRITADAACRYQQTSGAHVFAIADSGAVDSAISWATAMMINNTGNCAHKYTGGGGGVTIDRTDSSGAATLLQFFTGGNHRGYISYNGAAIVYATSSDYRLKENVEPMSGSIDRLMQLKPSRFNFIENPTMDMDGFLAHEVQSIVPEAISGQKDDMEDYEVTPAVLDDEHNVVEPAVMDTRILPQGIDQSKLVPLLTAALQDAIKRIEILENA
jgi:hypothetical protein